MRKIIAAASIALCLLAQANAQSVTRAVGSSNIGLIDTILRWLPPNAETVIVAQAPFQLEERATTKPTGLSLAQVYVTGLLGIAEDGHLVKGLSGRTIQLAAIGARQFEWHSTGLGRFVPFGLIAYQGCAAYSFRESVPESSLVRSADEHVMGYPVWISKGSQSDAPKEDVFTVILKADLLLVCNDRSFMSEMIARSVSAGGARALPADLPEWKLVDRTAPLWAVRHYRADRMKVDPSRTGAGDDISATGLTLEIGSTGLMKARMLVATDPWHELVTSPDASGKAVSKQPTKGVWELSISEGNPDDSYFGVFAIMAMLGLAVII